MIKNPYLFRDTIAKLVTTEAMPYEKLTASKRMTSLNGSGAGAGCSISGGRG